MAINSSSYGSQYPTRSQVDASKATSIALPIISGTINTNAIDLEAAGPFPSTETISFIATIPAANANSGNAAVLSFQLQHSATNVSANFVNVPGTGPLNINSVNAFYPTTNLNFGAPDNLLQFVRLQGQQTAGGANSANAVNVTFELAF